MAAIGPTVQGIGRRSAGPGNADTRIFQAHNIMVMAAQISPVPAPGEERSVALALINTEIEPRGQRLDLVPDARALAGWLRAHDVKVGGGAIGEEELDRMRELRGAIRTAFLARAAGTRPAAGAIRQINSAAALVPATPRVQWRDGRLIQTKVWTGAARPADRALAAIAADAIGTLLGDSGKRLRLCEAHGCNRMFIAVHRRRRWCSRSCGDRVRVARHYRRVNRSRSS